MTRRPLWDSMPESTCIDAAPPSGRQKTARCSEPSGSLACAGFRGTRKSLALPRIPPRELANLLSYQQHDVLCRFVLRRPFTGNCRVVLLTRDRCCSGIVLFASARLSDDLVQRGDSHERAQSDVAGHLLGVDGHPGSVRKANFQGSVEANVTVWRVEPDQIGSPDGVQTKPINGFRRDPSLSLVQDGSVDLGDEIDA